MPRFLVERTFPGGLAIPANVAGAEACLRVVRENAALGVTWIQSYVSADLETMVCVYEGPDEDAIRAAAARNELPLDRLTRVTVLDPHFYTGTLEPMAPAVPNGGQR
jgi:Nickel responsive protein SCO4226-like